MNKDPWVPGEARLRWALAPVAVVLGVVLVTFAVLRENPLFWRHAGGYPIWLREVVLTGFGLLATAEYGLLLLISGLFIGGPPRTLRAWWFESTLLALAWLLAAFALLVVASNNVFNLIEGRPLHHHPEVRWRIPTPAARTE